MLHTFAKKILKDVFENVWMDYELFDVNNLNVLEVSFWVEGSDELDFYYNTEKEFRERFKKDLEEIKTEILNNPLKCPCCKSELSYLAPICFCGVTVASEDSIGLVLKEKLNIPEDKVLELVDVNNGDLSRYMNGVSTATHGIEEGFYYFVSNGVSLKSLDEIDDEHKDCFLFSKIMMSSDYDIGLVSPVHKYDDPESIDFDKKHFCLMRNNVEISYMSTRPFADEGLSMTFVYEDLLFDLYKEKFNLTDDGITDDFLRIKLTETFLSLNIDFGSFYFGVYDGKECFVYAFTDQDKLSELTLMDKIDELMEIHDELIVSKIKALMSEFDI